MEYTIKFINGNKLVAIAIIGMALSIFLSIYFRINFGLNKNIMIGIILSGFILPWIIAYYTSKQEEIFQVNGDGLLTRKYGLIKWKEVDSLGLQDNTENEAFTIRLHSGNKIRIPSNIKDSPNRNSFIAFKYDVQNRFAQSRNITNDPIQHSYAFDGKRYRLIGNILIIVLILSTVFGFYTVAIGDISVKELTGLAIAFGCGLPMIARIFRNELFGRKN